MEEHRNDATRANETDERRTEEPKGTGDVLGISRPPVVPAATDEVRPIPEGDSTDVNDEERKDSRVGARDLTDGTTGGTGPDTGGTGVYRKGSGATGTDIGR
ncbi:MAG TPA: hypothetical protein VK911_01625 [Vicinamibacterales bacterium]|nr:hypothetical protein [Vicinamibacterales bacterium]